MLNKYGEAWQPGGSTSYPYAPGAVTKLGAIPVPSEPVGTFDQLQKAETHLRKFAQTAKHLYLVAFTGAGKGVWLSNYIRWRKQAEPTLRVFWIDPKNDSKEDGYFDEPWIESCRYKATNLPIDEVIDKTVAAFNAHKRFLQGLPEDTPVLLIVDECMLVQHLLNSQGKSKAERGALETQIISAASVGDSANQHLICVSQSPNAGDSGVSGGVLRTLRKVILFKEHEADVVQQAKNCGAIAGDIPTEATLNELCRQSPVGRGFYLEGQYLPMPKLTNYSGYDRDTRRWANEKKRSGNRLEKQLREEATPKAFLYGEEPICVDTIHEPSLPKGIPPASANNFLKAIRSWLEDQSPQEPVSQSTLKSSSTQRIKKAADACHSRGVWIPLLDYYGERGELVITKTKEGGIRVSLPEWGAPEEEDLLADFNY